MCCYVFLKGSVLVVASQSDRSRKIDARNQLISMMSSLLTSYRERLIDPCEQEIIRILNLTIRHFSLGRRYEKILRTQAI